MSAAVGLAVVLSCEPVQAKTVALAISITIDKLAPEEEKGGMKIGMVHTACVYYDDTKIDPVSKRVVAIHETHAGGIPRHLNAQQMPMNNAWLDLSGTPIRYHFAAAPTTALPAPYFVLFSETTMRMSIYRQADGELLLAGNYKVDPTPITGPAVEAVVASADPALPPWETAPQGMMPRPQLPAGAGASASGAAASDHRESPCPAPG